MKFSIKHSIRWSLLISVITLFLASVFSVISTIILAGVTWGIGLIIVLFLVVIGILFDIMGLASAAAKESPFHAMASERVPGARHAIVIVRNADRFSNFCNDVIGDIAGIISGAATAVVVTKLIVQYDVVNPVLTTITSVVLAGLVSAITVGGKAMGKSFAINYSTPIMLWVGRFFHFLEHRMHLRIFNVKRNHVNNGRRGSERATRSNKSTK